MGWRVGGDGASQGDCCVGEWHDRFKSNFSDLLSAWIRRNTGTETRRILPGKRESRADRVVLAAWTFDPAECVPSRMG